MAKYKNLMMGSGKLYVCVGSIYTGGFNAITNYIKYEIRILIGLVNMQAWCEFLASLLKDTPGK